LAHPKASLLLQAMFSGMGGGMGDAFSAAMDGDDEPMLPQAEPTKPTTQPKEATADPNAGLTDVQKQAVDEKNKGNEAYKKKDFETALSHYNKAIELDPTNITYYTNKAG
jgi:tetratricopeptide (TPR) repeat protein